LEQLDPYIERLLEPLAEAYRTVAENAGGIDDRRATNSAAERPRDFYGLRDFYFLIKSAFLCLWIVVFD
jgi:hypothetical protein